MAARVKKRTGTSTNRESDKVIARLPEGMRAALATLAERNGRSMNAEIVLALAIHLAEHSTPPVPPSPEEVIQETMQLNAQFKRLIKQMKEIVASETKEGS